MTNNDIKFIRSLGQKKFRDQYGIFVVEGEKMVKEAVASGWDVVAVYNRDEIGEEAMSRISMLSSPSPSLALVRKPVETSVPDIPSGLCLALDSVRDPGNLGTILRIADWFGVSAIFASPDCAELYNPKVIQASMGSIFRMKVRYCDLADVCRRFRDAGSTIYGTFLEGRNIYDGQLAKDALVVMGNESNGISAGIEALVDRKITIPSFGSGAESLNVAVATAVTVSEFRRQSHNFNEEINNIPGSAETLEKR